MYKLKTGDKVRLVLHGLNSYYSGRDFIIHDEKGGKYQLKGGTSEYFFDIAHFEYIQPQALTVEMASEPDVIVNCRTEEDAKYFCNWLDLHKKRWITGYAYSNQTNWNRYKEDTCYSVSQGLYGDANLKCWKKQDDNEKDIIAIIRFKPSMIQNDCIWAKSEACKGLSKTTEKPNKNGVLTDVIESTTYKITYKNIPVINRNNIEIGTLPQEILHINPKITNIEFNDKITNVTIGGKQIKVNCQDCDTYSKEQAITQAIAKYCGFGTKKINELIEKFNNKKEEFKPYLTNTYSDFRYGFIGEKSPFKDAIGRELYVGDVVELFADCNTSYGYAPICKNSISGYFIMGIENSSANGKLKGVWKIILFKRHSEISDNEIVDGEILYIKTPPKSNTK